MLEAVKTRTNHGTLSWYRSLSLVNLIREIAEKSDLHALDEFHNNRTLFRYADSPPLLFTEFLEKLREATLKRDRPGLNVLEIADLAYNLTVDKFSNLPEGPQLSTCKKSKNGQKVKRKGADCRLYFKAFIKRAEKSFGNRQTATQLEEEFRVAKIMQGLVRRHFILSRLEAERNRNRFRSRYNWAIKDRIICVWLPVSLKGQERRAWLEKNIDDPDPHREGERERIQAIINQNLIREEFVPFPEAHSQTDDETPSCSGTDEEFGKSLAEIVAKEKADHIKQQRRAIQALGKERLKQLVLCIFEDIHGCGYSDGKVAKDFGLSKATLSRFAGSQWHEKETSIPDLWLNTAQVLSENSTFKEVVKETGFWKQVKATLEKGTQRRAKEPSHE